MWWRRLRYVLLLVALCAIATCPAARRACVARTRAAEADQLLGYLADRVAAQVAATGRVPPAPAGPTPKGCCGANGAGGAGEPGGAGGARGDGVCNPDAALWAEPGWRALGFSIDGPHRYTYQYVPDASGLSATLRAVADLACDGAASTVELKLAVVGGTVTRAWSRSTPVR